MSQYIAIFHIFYWKCKNKIDKQAAAYDLGSVNTSHYIDNSAGKYSQNDLIQNFLSNSFEQNWQITENTDAFAIISKWKKEIYVHSCT